MRARAGDVHSAPLPPPATAVRFALNLDNGRDEMDVSGLVRLDLAAHRLGCHVETLRIRVRDGRLPAVKGPHGAYYVSEPALVALPPLGRPVFSRAAVTAAEREQSWQLVERLVIRAGGPVAMSSSPLFA